MQETTDDGDDLDIIGRIEHDDRPFVYEVRPVKAIVNGGSYSLKEYVILEGVAPDGFTRFTADVQVKLGDTPQGPLCHTEEVALEGETLGDAAEWLAARMKQMKAAIYARGKKHLIRRQLEESALAAKGPLSQELGRMKSAAARSNHATRRRRSR